MEYVRQKGEVVQVPETVFMTHMFKTQMHGSVCTPEQTWQL